MKVPAVVSLAILAAPGAAPPGTKPAGPTPEEKSRLAELAAKIDGAVIYTHRGSVRKVVVGRWEPVDLGPGQYARWSPDGKRIAVYYGRVIYVMNADGTGRKRLAAGADREDGCPVAFHPNNEEVVFWRRQGGFHAVRIADGKVRRLALPASYSGSPGFSADGGHMTCRWDNDLYAVEVGARTHRKYARGCSPGVSPDGKWLMNNTGGHRTLVIRGWDGEGLKRIDARGMHPDRMWDELHWSNHADFIAGQGEGAGQDAYVVQVSTGRVCRVSWEGGACYPDLYVAKRGVPATQPAAEDAR